MSRYARVITNIEAFRPKPSEPRTTNWGRDASPSAPSDLGSKYDRVFEQVNTPGSRLTQSPSGSHIEGTSPRLASNLLPGDKAWRAELDRLRGAVLTAKHLHGVQVILVCGTRSDSGATAVAAYLSLALAELDRARVALADFSQLENGVKHYLAEDVPDQRLKEVLSLGGDVRIQQTGVEDLRLVAVSQDQKPMALVLQSDDWIRRIRKRFGFVIFSAPPVVVHPDTALLATKVGGVILVVEQNTSRLNDLEAAREELERVDANVLGIVLNQCREYLPKLLADRL